MLQKMNERVKGLFAWIVVILIALTFAMFGVDYFMQARQSTSAVAEVNGQTIPVNVFEQVYRRFRHQDNATLSAPEDEAVKKKIVEELIVNTLILQAAHQVGFYVSPNQVTESILQIPQFQEKGQFSQAKYQQVLAASMYTPSLLRDEIAQGLLINQQRFTFVKSNFALPSEIKKYAAILFETRDYEYATLPIQPFLQKITPTEKEKQDYYQTHAKDFITPPRVSLDYVTLSMDAFKAKAAVTDAEVNQYYQDNLSIYKTQPQWKLAHLFYAFPPHATPEQQTEIKQKAEQAYQTLTRSPELFNEWVKTKSDDRLSAQKGGVLPTLSLGQSQFDDALKQLTKVGQISAPVKTSQGYELFKVLEYRPSIVKPLADEQVQIKTQLINEKAQVAYAKALETLGEISYQNPDTLEPAAQALNLTIMHTQPFPQAGGTDPLTQNPEVLRVAFSSEVKELGNNSEPIQLNPTQVVVVRVNKQFPAEPTSYQTVANKIESILKTQAAEKELNTFAQQVMNGKQALPASTKWELVTKASRRGETTNPTIRDVAFKLSKPKQMKQERLPNGDFLLVRLQAIHPGQYDALDQAQRETLKQQVQMSYGTIDYDLYVKELMDEGNIKRF